MLVSGCSPHSCRVHCAVSRSGATDTTASRVPAGPPVPATCACFSYTLAPAGCVLKGELSPHPNHVRPHGFTTTWGTYQLASCRRYRPPLHLSSPRGSYVGRASRAVGLVSDSVLPASAQALAAASDSTPFTSREPWTSESSAGDRRLSLDCLDRSDPTRRDAKTASTALTFEEPSNFSELSTRAGSPTSKPPPPVRAHKKWWRSLSQRAPPSCSRRHDIDLERQQSLRRH